jgi:mannose-6-phosphate isomerase
VTVVTSTREARAAVVSGLLMPYAWGAVDAMAPWTFQPTGGPEAELWFGTHGTGASPVVAALPGGASVGVAPLLVKVLAAAHPLSLQVHPDDAAISRLVAEGHGDLLADRRPKAEMLIAVQSFELLAGLRGRDDSLEILRALGRPQEADCIRQGDIAQAVRGVLAAGVPEQRRVDAALGVLPGRQRQTMQRVVDSFGDDPGLGLAFLLQPLRLDPGEGIYIRPGTIHAYVHGLGVEVMTSCDDVLRFGLTPKQVAVEAALTALDVHAPVVRLHPAKGTHRYASAGCPFEVTRLVDGTQKVPPHSIVLAFEGSAVLNPMPETDASIAVDIHDVVADLPLAHGHAALLGSGTWAVQTPGTAFIASPLPVHS